MIDLCVSSGRERDSACTRGGILTRRRRLLLCLDTDRHASSRFHSIFLSVRVCTFVCVTRTVIWLIDLMAVAIGLVSSESDDFCFISPNREQPRKKRKERKDASRMKVRRGKTSCDIGGYWKRV